MYEISLLILFLFFLDQVFLTLYRELYYRHIYARLTPTLEQRFHSYENYCDLFNYILSKYSTMNNNVEPFFCSKITNVFLPF